MSERLYSTDFASVCINHHKPEEHSSVVTLKAELAELRQKAAFADEMVKWGNRRIAAWGEKWACEGCPLNVVGICDGRGYCEDVLSCWEAWQEVHRETE